MKDLFNPFIRIFFEEDDGSGGGGGDAPEMDTDTDAEAPDASTTTETETDSDDEGDHPGALDDKEAEEAVKAAKAAGGAGAAPIVDPNAFKPNYEIKVYGKKAGEIPEKFRGLITDATSEKEVRDIFEKAYALDEYKPKQEQMRQKVEHYEQKVLPAYQQQDQIINECLHHVKHGDFDSYFETLGIPVDNVLRWVEKKLSFTPEQAALYNQNRELQKNIYRQGIENSQLKTTSEQSISEAQQRQADLHLQELSYTLAKGEYAPRVTAYDAKHGENSFRNMVIKHGDYVHKVEGRNLSFEEAAKEVLDRVAPASAPQTLSPTQKTVAPKDKPVLPVVSPRPVSPTVKQPKSIADIRRKAESMHSAQSE